MQKGVRKSYHDANVETAGSYQVQSHPDKRFKFLKNKGLKCNLERNKGFEFFFLLWSLFLPQNFGKLI